MYYYAITNEKYIVDDVQEYSDEILQWNFILITSLDTSLIGAYWDSDNQTFINPAPFNIVADHSTDEINVGTSNTCLTDKISTMETSIGGKAASGHNHDEVYAGIDHNHDEVYSDISHTHTEYAASTHNHDNSYAGISHNHSGYAAANHVHSGYATSTHSHSNYASSTHSHTSFNNDVNIDGILSVDGKQMIYIGDSVILGTNTMNTIICGSGQVLVNGSVFYAPSMRPRNNGTAFDLGSTAGRWRNCYLQNSPNVSSDERLKENIKDVDENLLLEFICNISPVEYNYSDSCKNVDDKKKTRFGIIAQNVLKANEKFGSYIVDKDEAGFYGVKPADLVYALIGAVKALSDRVKELEK